MPRVPFHPLTVDEYRARSSHRKLGSFRDTELLSQWIKATELRLQDRFRLDLEDFDYTDKGKFAVGSVTFQELPTAGQTVRVGAITYSFVSALTAAYDVLIGVDTAATAANLIAAVNAATGEGTTYGTGTVASTVASAAIHDTDTDLVLLTARATGYAANAEILTSTDANIVTVDFTGGEDSAIQQRDALEDDFKTATIITLDHDAHNPLGLSGRQTVTGTGSHRWNVDVPSRARQILSRWGNERQTGVIR